MEEQYRTPTGDGEVTVIPAADSLPEAARANAKLGTSYEFKVLDVPASTLAAQVRADVLRLAREYTTSLGLEAQTAAPELIVATGHQPVLPHPGIWLKNHLASRVARQLGAASVNFIVDNDTVDLNTINVPADDEGLQNKAVPFIDCPHGMAAEEIVVRCDAVGALREAARLARTALADSLADEFVASASPAEGLTEFVSRPRRRLEESFGVRNLELPVSLLCSTDGFLALCAHIVTNAEQFFGTYNRVLDRHRARQGITNPVEPSPNLMRQAGRLELPFWVWRKGEARGPMFVACDAAETLVCEGTTIVARIPRSTTGAADVVAVLRRAFGAGFKIRPRALTMTMFFRLFCCDLFIHGMGGARYEPANDAIIREFFAAEPPVYVTASATLFVKPKAPAPSAQGLVEMRQRIRRMKMTPERFVEELLPDDLEAHELARQRAALLDMAGLSKRERRRAFAESKRLAARLRERLAPHILGAENELARAEKNAAARSIIEDRTYPFFLHARAALQRLYESPQPER